MTNTEGGEACSIISTDRIGFSPSGSLNPHPLFVIDSITRETHHLNTMKRHLPLLALLLMFPLSSCTSHLQKKENFLTQAGFRAVNPTTPAQIAHFQSLPPGHIRHEERNGKTLYMLADPSKKLLLVGGEAEYAQYQEILYAREVEPGKKADKFTKGLASIWDQGWGSVLGSMVPQ